MGVSVVVIDCLQCCVVYGCIVCVDVCVFCHVDLICVIDYVFAVVVLLLLLF